MNESGAESPDESKNVMMEAYRRLQAKAKQAQMDVNSQVAKGGERFMSPEESQANADFITNQIGEGAVSGGTVGVSPNSVAGGTAGLAEQVGGQVVRPNAGYGGIVNAPIKSTSMAESMAANANPNRVNSADLLKQIRAKFGNNMVK
jgi:hypothetical protein